MVAMLGAALLDQEWHLLDGDRAELAAEDVEAFEAPRWSGTASRSDLVPPRYRTGYFAHVFAGGYDAGYYSYLWSEVLDADLVELVHRERRPDAAPTATGSGSSCSPSAAPSTRSRRSPPCAVARRAPSRCSSAGACVADPAAPPSYGGRGGGCPGRRRTHRLRRHEVLLLRAEGRQGAAHPAGRRVRASRARPAARRWSRPSTSWPGWRDEAPDDIEDEWDTLVQALRGLSDAIRESGADPGDFAAGGTPDGVSAGQLDAVQQAARELQDLRVQQAGTSIEQHARDVCKVDLGSSGLGGVGRLGTGPGAQADHEQHPEQQRVQRDDDGEQGGAARRRTGRRTAAPAASSTRPAPSAGAGARPPRRPSPGSATSSVPSTAKRHSRPCSSAYSGPPTKTTASVGEHGDPERPRPARCRAPRRG